MVDICGAIDASVLGIAQNEVDVFLLQPRDEIILTRRLIHNSRYSFQRRLNINFVLSFLKAAVNSGAAGEFAEARCLERSGNHVAAVICSEIHQTVILASVYLSVGLLTLYII